MYFSKLLLGFVKVGDVSLSTLIHVKVTRPFIMHHNEDWHKILSKLLIQGVVNKQDSKKSLSVNKCTSAYSLCLINVRLCLYEAVRN